MQSGTSGLYDGIKTELYTSGRYLTLTGNTLRSGPLAELRGLAEMAQSMRGVKSGIDQSTGEIVGATTVVDAATEPAIDGIDDAAPKTSGTTTAPQPYPSKQQEAMA